MTRIPLATIGLAFGIVMLAIAIVASISGAPGFVIGWLSAVGILAIAGTVFERVRYKPLGRQPPGIGFAATEERFRDPATGSWVQVYYNCGTGERRYVAIDPPTN
jgi:hypothetical protein